MFSSDLMTKMTSMVPEFYYDLIARIIPGFLTLLAFVVMYSILFPYEFEVLTWKTILGQGSFFASLLLLVVSYFLGIVVAPLGVRIRHFFWYWAKLRTHEKQRNIAYVFAKNLGMDEHPFGNLKDFKSFEKIVEKELEDHMPHDRMVLVKMWAESDMCFNVLSGIIIIDILILIFSLVKTSIGPWIGFQIVLLPILVLLSWDTNFRHRGVIRRDLDYIKRLNLVKKNKEE